MHRLFQVKGRLVLLDIRNVNFVIRSESSGGGAGAEAVVALVAQLFPAAVLEENFAERLVFSVPQSSVSSLARCFQQIEDGKQYKTIDEIKSYSY